MAHNLLDYEHKLLAMKPFSKPLNHIINAGQVRHENSMPKM